MKRTSTQIHVIHAALQVRIALWLLLTAAHAKSLKREESLETVEDQEIINSYGGLDNTPSYLVRLRPVLKINGERVVVAQDGLPMGSEYDLTIELRGAGGTDVASSELRVEKITNSLIVGNLSVIGVVAQRAAAITPSTLGGEGGGEGEKDAERLLYEAAQHYIDRWNQAEDELASLLHLTVARPMPTIVTVGGVIDVAYLLDMPHGFTWKGVFVDADLRTVETVASDELRVKNFMQLSSLQGSILENRIFEDDFQVESISTAKLFQIFNAQLVNPQPATQILTIDKTNIETILPTLPFDDNIKEDITNSVNQNLTVRIPQSEITYQDWTGIGYIKENSETGESGWMLSGMIAGGMTAWDISKWNDIISGTLSAPYSEPPNYDPASARYIQKITASDMQTGTVGTQLTDRLQVQVLDQNKKGVKNVVVTFKIRAGGGTLKGDLATGPSVTAKTKDRGIASVTLTLGQKTSDNPTFMDEGKTYYQQVGENIVDATLPSGTGITIPFTALGVPKQAHHMRPVHGNGTWSAALSFAGFVSVAVEDEYNNPVSNIPVTFTVSDPTQNPGEPNCTWTSQDSRKTYFTEAGLPCLKDSPIWGTCGDTLRSSLTVTSDHTGAATPVILGGMEDAIYAINASAPNNLNANFKLYTYDLHARYNRPCDNTEDPLRQLFVAYTYPSDRQGNSINAGKVGTTIPVQAKLYSLVEGETEKNVTVTCSSGSLTCSKIVGNRQYDTTSDYTNSSVTFSGVSGTSHGGGIYTANYTLKPGLNTIAIDATASLSVNSTNMACPSTCNTKTVTLTQTDSTSMQVYGVDILVEALGQVFVDENGYSLNNLQVNYTIMPAEYKASFAYVILYKDGTPIAYISSETKATGFAVFSKGFQFDVNNTYEVEVVLNYGTGVEIKSGRSRVQVSLLQISLVDQNDNPITLTQIGEKEEFVTWKTLELRYKITPILPDTEYTWEITGAAATKAGHSHLGTPVPQNIVIDKANRTIKFDPRSTGGSKYNINQRAKPLAYALNFKIKGQLAKTIAIEQSYKNAIREEYKIYDVPGTNLPAYTDFDRALKNEYHFACPYDAADVPRGAKLNKLGGLLPEGKYSITNSYRNPYKNDQAGSNSAKSSHVWSGAFDLNAADGTTVQLKELRDNIISKTEFGQVYLESSGTKSDPDLIKRFLEDYIKVNLKKAIVDGSLTYSLPCGAETYSIVWSKASNCGVVGWKTVAFSWKETESQQVPTPGEYIFKEGDWDIIARNLHVQDKISDKWGFEP